MTDTVMGQYVCIIYDYSDVCGRYGRAGRQASSRSDVNAATSISTVVKDAIIR